MKRALPCCLGLVLTALLAACQGVAPERSVAPDGERAVFEAADFEREGVVSVLAADDPFEPMNRAIYKFNALFDEALFVPVTGLYEFLLPDFVEDRVSNAFANLGEVGTFANAILQGKIARASRAAVRFLVNTTIGLGGLFDPMGALGTRRQSEDLGQTLGVWGFPDGPFLVLPVLGPSNLRDALGLAGESLGYSALDAAAFDGFQADHPEIQVLQALDQRHQVGVRYFQTGSPFEYDLVRLLYTRMRELDIAK